ncbi:MAG: hypothetical protein ABI333_08990 [bacterium]
MRKRMIATLTAALLGATLWGCGEGRWGSEVQLSLAATDHDGQPLAAGDELELHDQDFAVEVDRACVSVELVVVTQAGGAEAGGGDCYCHGDPPECHGDCSGTSTSDPGAVVAEIDGVVDLLAGPVELLRRGAAPADYTQIMLAFSAPHEPVADPPPACSDMDGRTFVLEGTLVDLVTLERRPLRIDLREPDQLTNLTADPPASATDEQPGALAVGLVLGHLLGHVDFAAVVEDATGTITIGGDQEEHEDAAQELLQGLTEAGSFAVSVE